MKSQIRNMDVKEIRHQITNDKKHISNLHGIIKELSKRISDNEKKLYIICDHQWKITRDIHDDHSLKSCHLCGLEKY